MYGDYWKLSRLPFENRCDPDFFFRGRSHEAALLKMQYVVEQSKGISLLIGEHGTGKTLLSRALEAELAKLDGDTKLGPVVRLMFPRLSANEMLEYLADRLSEMTGDRLSAADHLSLNTQHSPLGEIQRLESVLQQYHDDGRHPVFIIDDAHQIDLPAVLQALAQVMAMCEVRGISLSLVLLGQPDLLAQVQRVPAMNSRVAIRAALQPLDADETADYIRHRLNVAGLDVCMFDEEALDSFHRLSLGFPRRINQLCDLALLVGYADELPRLGRSEIEAASDELLSVSID